MAQLFQAYKSWNPEKEVVEEWMKWVDEALNHGSDVPAEGKRLSIELVLGWSVTRISVVASIPLILSLAIGLWLNSSNWTDNITIQTAWLVASYVVAAGACMSSFSVFGTFFIADSGI
jgi:hypothetical protein